MLIRVYYEDTDAAGVVYHSNYLNFLERARTEYFRERGFGVADLAAEGYVFPVIRAEIDFRAPARHDDLLQIATDVQQVNAASLILKQKIIRAADGRLLVEGVITLACIGPHHTARRIPSAVRQVLAAEIACKAEMT